MVSGSAASATVAVVPPIAFMLRLPLGEHCEFLSALGPAAKSLYVSSHPDRAGCSSVPFTTVLGLGHQFPHMRELHLRSVVVHPGSLHASPAQLPSFIRLESLTIIPWSAQLSGEAAITRSLLGLFPHMPRLRDLRVYTPITLPAVERPTVPLQYPQLPFSLKRFICIGALSVPACAHIISHSRGTLEELKVNLAGHEDGDEALLVAAIARAAPRLRKLDLSLRGDNIPWLGVKSVFAALARVEIIHLQTPQSVQDALDLLGSHVSLRELSLWCTLDLHNQPSLSAAEQLTGYMLRTRRLRSVILRRYKVGDENQGALFELCRARRIRCCITN